MIHLHVKSCYSLLESPLTIDDLIRLAKENHQSAVSLTDHRALFGAAELQRKAKAAGLKPILGLEFELNWKGQIVPVILIAKDGQGLQNLYALSTRLMEGLDALEAEELEQYAGHTIAMNAGGHDLFQQWARENRLDELAEFFHTLDLAADQSYIALSLADSPVFQEGNQHLIALAQATGLPTVALSRVEYEKPEDETISRLLKAIGAQTRLNDPTLPRRSGRYWRSAAEMESLYPAITLDNTEQIADQIEDYEIEKAHLPVYANPAGVSSEEYLKNLALAGLKKRLNGKSDPRYTKRLHEELEIILKMGFADYFLIVWDFIREARKRGVLVGPGRGSAAGSLTAYCLGISHVDPIANGLLFERFLNPSRISMPDIDTDIPDNRRDEMIRYVASRYGQGQVAHIVTFARMKARMALRDTAKVLGVSDRKISALLRKAPSGPNLTLKEMETGSRAFEAAIKADRELSQVFAYAQAIEGLPRHTSIHAGGIVISGKPIPLQAPLMDAQADVPAVQFTMDYLEERGLIKFDFLALRYLSVLEEMKEAVQKRTGKPLDLLKLPLDDPAVFALLARGQTMGIFQLESAGITNLIVRLKPYRFEDIPYILALYRPGPMKHVNEFLEARFHPEKRRSIHPMLDGLLAETGGIFLYQEQIMEAARLIGGFTLAEADSLRKAMSKKNHEVMATWRAQFIEGAANRGIEEQKAREIFAIMERFADYGFNKSHSYAYALIVYQMAWIKARAPLEFYQASINSLIGNGEKIGAMIREMNRRNLPVQGPTLNYPTTISMIEQGRLMLPLVLISSINKDTVGRIRQELEEHGPYTDPALSVLRLLNAGLKAEQVRALIEAGALDELGIGRESLLESFENIVRFGDLVSPDENGQWQFCGVTPPQIQLVPVHQLERVAQEKKRMGFSLSTHPATLIRQRDRRIVPIEAIVNQNGYFTITGQITRIQPHTTKKGDEMAFATLMDETGEIDLAIMPDLYLLFKDRLKPDMMVIVSGKKDRPKSMVPAAVEIVERI